MENMSYLVKFIMMNPIKLLRKLKNWDQDLENPPQRSELLNANSILCKSKYFSQCLLGGINKAYEKST